MEPSLPRRVVVHMIELEARTAALHASRRRIAPGRIILMIQRPRAERDEEDRPYKIAGDLDVAPFIARVVQQYNFEDEPRQLDGHT